MGPTPSALYAFAHRYRDGLLIRPSQVVDTLPERLHRQAGFSRPRGDALRPTIRRDRPSPSIGARWSRHPFMLGVSDYRGVVRERDPIAVVVVHHVAGADDAHRLPALVEDEVAFLHL